MQLHPYKVDLRDRRRTRCDDGGRDTETSAAATAKDAGQLPEARTGFLPRASGGPANTLIAGCWPPGLGENILSHQVCGTLLS